VGQLLCRTWREPAPAAVATRIDCRCSRGVCPRAIEVHCELLASDRDVAIFVDHVGPRLGVVRIVMIGRHRLLSLCSYRQADEESNAQQSPTMNEAACFHVLIFS